MLVLPEMALTGYIFANRSAISHLLEDPENEHGGSSPSLQLAKELAIRLQCYVVVGCPIKVSSSLEKAVSCYDARSIIIGVGNKVKAAAPQVTENCYNAALLVDAQGHLVHVFRKHFSYKDDKRWAIEGPGFETVTLPDLGRVCIAICMDLNRESPPKGNRRTCSNDTVCFPRSIRLSSAFRIF